MKYAEAYICVVALSLAFAVSALESTAQYPTNATALRALCRSAPHDTTKAQALLYLAVAIHAAKPDTIRPLCEEVLRIVNGNFNPGLTGPVLKSDERKAYRRIKATAHLNLGHYYHERRDSIAALKHYETAHLQFVQLGFWCGAGDALIAMGMLHKESGVAANGVVLIDRAKRFFARGPKVTYGSTGFKPAGMRVEPLTAVKDDEERAQPEVIIEQTKEPASPQNDTQIKPIAQQSGSDEHAEEVVALEKKAEPQPRIHYSTASSGDVRHDLTALGINTATIAKYRERLTKPIQKGDSEREAREHLEMGEAWELMREPELAITSFKRSREVFNTLRSDSGECVALLRIGKIRGEQNEYEAAFAVLDSARNKARTIGRRDLEGLALVAMGDMCRRIEECGGSTDLYRRSIALAQATGDRRTEARGYLAMTADLVKKGSIAEAEPLGQKGLDIATEVNDPDLRQQGAVLLRGVYTQLGREQEAQVMEELAQETEAIISDRDWALDSIIYAMRMDFARIREQDSLAHQEVRSELESNWLGERMQAKKNRSAAFIIAGSALVAIMGGAAFYRLDRRRRQVRAARLATDLEIKALRAQMNPHFLFNALSSIHEHILDNEAEVAAGYLAKFSKLMRQVLEMSRMNEVPLQRELEVLGMYTELERMRLKDRFSYSVDISPEVDPEAVTVPPMLLQPFVENAVWHGLSRKEGPGHLRIAVSEMAGALCVSISDDGLGRQITSEKSSGHTSLGTSITKERLDLWAEQRGAPAQFAFVPVPVGTRVELTLPWVES